MKRFLLPQAINKFSTFCSFNHYAEAILPKSRVFWLLLIAGFLLMGESYAQVTSGIAPVYPPTGGFHIEGDLRANTPTVNKGDWVSGVAGTGGFVLNNDGSPIDPTSTYHLLDLWDSQSDNKFSGGDKFIDDPDDWGYVYTKATGKLDMNNALIHLTTDTTNGEVWIIFSADRLSQTGDSYIDFEFYQDSLYLDNNGHFHCDAPDATGGRAVGDFILTVHFGNNITTEFELYRWELSGSTYTYVLYTTPPVNSVYAAANTVSVSVPYPAFGNNSYVAKTFVEAAVNLSRVLGSINACSDVLITSILIKSKASNASTADLDDFIAPLQVSSLEFGSAQAGDPQNGCNGGNFTVFTMDGLAIPSPGYSVVSTTWSTVSYDGGTAPTIVTPSSLTSNVNVYGTTATMRLTVVTTNGSNTCTVADEVVLTVLPAISFGTLTSGDENICSGGDPSDITFSIPPAGGTGTFTYEWYYKDGIQDCPSGTDNSGWTFTGVTTTSFNPPAGLTVSRTYAVMVNPTGIPDCGDATWVTNCRKVTVIALPTITLGSNPSICKGLTTANLTYSATTGSPDQYSIVYDAAALAQGFLNVSNATLTASPVVLAVPAGGSLGTYNGTLTVMNTTTGCASNGIPFTVTLDSCPALVITKTQTSGPSPVTAAGQIIGYTITVQNTGNVTLTGVTASDVLPDGSTGTLSGPAGDSGTIGAIDVGETWTYTISYTVTQADVDLGTALINTARVVTTEVPGPTEDTESTPVSHNPSLVVTKTQTSGPHPITAAGQIIGYTINVQNTGNVSLTGVTAGDVLPDGSAGTLTGPAGDGGTANVIDVGETWTYTISYTVTQDDMDDGTALVNTVSVVTNEVPGPTTDSESTSISQDPFLHVTKTQTGGPDPVTAAGQVINYTITLHNHGNVTLTGIVASDILPDGTTGTLSGPTGDSGIPGAIDIDETWTYTISYTVTQADMDAGSALVNTASGVANEVPDPATDTEITTISQDPSLVVTKTQTSGPDPVTAAGEVIGYTITVENEGNITLTGVLASDILPDGTAGTLSGPSGDLGTPGAIDVGEIWTYTISYTVTQEDINEGLSLINTASIVTNEVPGPTFDTESTPIINNPSLEVTKTQTSGPHPITAAGQIIGYTITVQNTGNVSLTGVTAGDVLPDGSAGTLTGPAGDGGTANVIDVGETWTYTISYTVTQDDMDDGTALVNTVSVVTIEVPGPTTDSESTSISQNPFLHVTKTQTGGPDPVTAAGQVINYTITLHNHGNVSLTGIVASDVLPDGTTGTLSGPTGDSGIPGAIDVDETWTYTISYTVTQADMDAGSALVNTASGVANEVPDPATDTEITTISQDPSLVVIKTQTSGPDPVTAAGQVIGYTITVENEGNVTLTGILASDILPDGTAGTLSGPAGDLGIPGAIDVGEIWTYTISYTVTQSDIDEVTALLNTASVVTTQVPGPTEDTESTPISHSPSLDVTKTQTSGPDPVTTAGQIIGYTITVQNTGNVSLTGVTAGDLLPDGSTGILTGPAGDGGTANVIDVGETWTYSISYTVTQDDIDEGSDLVNNVSVVTNEVPGPTEDFETTVIAQNPSLTIDKAITSGNPYDAVGDIIDYSFTITNTGNVTLAGPFTVVDDKIGTLTDCATGPLAPLASVMCTGSYSITQSDLDNGSVTNNAFATTTYSGNTISSNTDSETAYADQNPSISLEKTGIYVDNAPIGDYNAGDQINYTFTIINTGNVTLTNVIVTDPLVTVYGGPITSLAPGAMDNTTFTAIYILQESDLLAGTFTNIATVTGTPPSGPDVTDTDDDTHVSPCVSMEAWVYLEGSAINPGGTETYSIPMRTTLNDLHVLPGQTYQYFFAGIIYTLYGQPYNTAPWNYYGSEGDGYDSNGNPIIGAANYPPTVVDWVLVSLRTTPEGEPMCQKAALLHNDGHIEFVNGGFTCCDPELSNAYYLVIEHRNHLKVVSDNAISVIDGWISYDFRAQSNGQKEILPGVYAMYAGNGEQVVPGSENVINGDDRTYWEVQNGAVGRYRTGDYNLNGDCNYNDRTAWEFNDGIFIIIP